MRAAPSSSFGTGAAKAAGVTANATSRNHRDMTPSRVRGLFRGTGFQPVLPVRTGWKPVPRKTKPNSTDPVGSQYTLSIGRIPPGRIGDGRLLTSYTIA